MLVDVVGSGCIEVNWSAVLSGYLFFVARLLLSSVDVKSIVSLDENFL